MRLTKLSSATGHEADETTSSTCVEVEFAELEEAGESACGRVMSLQTMMVGQTRQYRWNGRVTSLKERVLVMIANGPSEKRRVGFELGLT